MPRLQLEKLSLSLFWLEQIQFFIVEKAITSWLMIAAKKKLDDDEFGL